MYTIDGNKLKRLARKKGLTKSDISKILNVHCEDIDKIIKGSQLLTREQLYILGACLNVRLEHLL